MKPSSYSERDYAFGQAMLTLRTALGLTQAGLAEFLGVSRKAVGHWESGGSYPTAEHLTALLTLAVQEGTFPAGREAEEMRAFWKAAHQKVLLDESWLSALLSQHPRPLERIVPPSIEMTGDATPPSLLLRVGRGWSGVRRWMCPTSMDASRNWRPSRAGWSRRAAGW